jgi:Uma2 family endonuclease
MVTRTQMTLEEFLALPEEKPYLEFVDGEVVQKAMPTEIHGALVAEVVRLLGNYLHDTREGRVVTEVRHLSAEDGWIFLPDISMTVNERRPSKGTDPVEVVPDFAIEVLSPEDRPGRILDRIDLYMRAGVRLLWIVDPEGKSITVHRRDERLRVVREGTLSAEPVLAGFTLDVPALFTTVASD